MPDGANCFGFAIEGGVVAAGDTRYVDGRWLTINRDGALMCFSLSAGFGRFANNDLGGSAGGAGKMCQVEDLRSFVVSLFTNEKYWELNSSREG